MIELPSEVFRNDRYFRNHHEDHRSREKRRLFVTLVVIRGIFQSLQNVQQKGAHAGVAEGWTILKQCAGNASSLLKYEENRKKFSMFNMYRKPTIHAMKNKKNFQRTQRRYIMLFMVETKAIPWIVSSEAFR